MDQLLQLALSHHQAGQLDAAEPIYRQILSANPNSAVTLQLLGLLLNAKGDIEQGLALVGRAAELEPNSAVILSNYTVVLNGAHRYQEAITIARRGIEIAPHSAELHGNLANALMNANQYQQAIESAQRAVELNPTIFDAWFTLGYSFLKRRQYVKAVQMFIKVIELQPTMVQPYLNLGLAFIGAGDFTQAELACRRAISLKSDEAGAHATLANVLSALGQPDESIQHRQKAFELEPTNCQILSALIFSHYSTTDFDPLVALDLAKRWETTYKPKNKPPAPTRWNHNRLRVGYISPDFYAHVVSRFLLPIISNQDKSRFEIYCYSDVPNPDEMTARLKRSVDHWRDTFELDDDQIFQLMRRDEIDILVDLTGHTADARMEVFALQPAWAQVAYLGYPGTTGLCTIGYRVTDAKADPPGLTDSHFTEKLVRLPRTAWCYDPGIALPPVASFDDSPDRPIRFGCFNKPSKMSKRILSIWAELLRQEPNARRVLKFRGSSADESRGKLLAQLTTNGIDPARVDFLPYAADFAGHLEQYRHVDIALDTFPYHGTTTTCDALLMGVPVVTLAGDTHVSRVGASLLHSIGLDDLIAQSPEQYIALAKSLANDRSRLKELRSTQRDRFMKSPLSDGAALARDFESALLQIWNDSAVHTGSPA